MGVKLTKYASPSIYSGKLILLLTMINMNDANVKETAIEKIIEKFLDLLDTLYSQHVRCVIMLMPNSMTSLDCW